MQYQKIIEKLGYTPKEAKIYLTALSLGEAHISDIAAKVKMPRTSVQIIVDKLYKNGLMNFYVMRRYKYWVAENPERLLADLKRREEMVSEAIPALIEIRKAAWGNRHTKKKDKKYIGLFRIIAEASSQPILITNEDSEIEYANTAWQKQFSYSLDEVQGKNPRILTSKQTPPEVFVRMWKALSEGKQFQSDEIIDKRKDGSLFNLQTTIFPLTFGSYIFYFQILDDITKEKHAENLKKSFMNAEKDTPRD